jgi:hypothetical protein
MADTSALRLSVHRTYLVNEDGSAGEEVEGVQSYSCTDHGIGFGDWELAAAHLEQQHSGQTNEKPPDLGISVEDAAASDDQIS